MSTAIRIESVVACLPLAVLARPLPDELVSGVAKKMGRTP